MRRSTRQNAAPVTQSFSYGGRFSGSYGRKAASWGSNFQRVDGRGRIGSGLAWRRTTDSQHSCRFPTLRLKICPAFSQITRNQFTGGSKRPGALIPLSAERAIIFHLSLHALREPKESLSMCPVDGLGDATTVKHGWAASFPGRRLP